MMMTAKSVVQSSTEIEARGLEVAYATDFGEHVALSGVDFAVAAGEFATLIGPSGCGKSTLLFCLGGLLAPSAGTVTQGGRSVTKPIPDRAAFVFQDYGLLPWKRVIDNVALGLQFAGVPRADRRERALENLRLMRLEDYAERYPAALSGGMQQRVAVARALAMQPDVLLMDEPFGALDEMTRRNVGLDVSRILTESAKSVVLVTHSLDEAIYWGDRVVVMSRGPGRIKQVFEVPEPRPRPLSFLTSDTFADLRRELLGALDE